VTALPRCYPAADVVGEHCEVVDEVHRQVVVVDLDAELALHPDQVLQAGDGVDSQRADDSALRDLARVDGRRQQFSQPTPQSCLYVVHRRPSC